MNSLHLLLTFILLIIIMGCGTNKAKQQQGILEQNMENAALYFKEAIEVAFENDKAPRGMHADGTVKFKGNGYDWTEGFFPGICWSLYEYTKEEQFKKAAEYFQSKYEHHKYKAKNHDLGFIFNCSFGKAYKITGNDSYKDVLIEASNSLLERFSPTVGCIQSWDVNRGWQAGRGWEFPVIIDNMMNLEMLFEASKLTGDPKYSDVAISHANKTLENHFREDFSSYHVIDYDPLTGKVRNKHTAQGYAHESAWARGQAWALYGFTMCYRYAKKAEYLHVAEKVASFILKHPSLPADKVPYWDFDAPNIPDEYRDVSSAAIIASALIELDSYSGNNYVMAARQIIESLSSEKYTTAGENNILILGHSVGSIPHGGEINVPIIYADYYYVEALMRLLKIEKMDAAVLP